MSLSLKTESVVLEEVLNVLTVPLEPGGVEPDRLHGLGHVPLAAGDGVVNEELLHLPRLLLPQQVNGRGLDES